MTEQSSLQTQYEGRFLESRNLPALPDVLKEAMALINGSKSNMQKIAAVISKDQVLAAKVLKMVNSPVYGFPGRIFSIQNALVLLGFNVIRGLIISTVVFENMPPDMMGLWEHSLATSIACRETVHILGLKNAEEYTLAGLLHDLGKVILDIQMPQAHEQVRLLVETQDITCYEAEKAVLGFSHAEINDWVATHWNLPVNLRIAISLHHAPMTATEHKTLACVVHLADFLARLFERGYGGDHNVPALDPLAARHLNMSSPLLAELVDRVGEAFARSFSPPQAS